MAGPLCVGWSPGPGRWSGLAPTGWRRGVTASSERDVFTLTHSMSNSKRFARLGEHASTPARAREAEAEGGVTGSEKVTLPCDGSTMISLPRCRPVPGSAYESIVY